jgi:hypothetical protein
LTTPQHPPTADLNEARRWLATLHGDAPGLINIVSTGNWTGANFTTDTAGINAAVNYIHTLDQQRRAGIYCRVTTLAAAPPPGTRGLADLSLSFPGFWADVDIAGPGHKTTEKLPATVEDARRIIETSGLPEPTMWIHSGGGLYPWWLLTEPHQIGHGGGGLDDISTLSARWQHVILAASEQLGYGYGQGVGDLARVLRVPGTINRKTALGRPCNILEASGQTYTLDELAVLLYTIDLPDPATPAGSPPPPRPRATIYTGSSQVGPFDALAEVAEWRDLFEPYGWTYAGSERDGAELWRRPDASSTYSARCGYHGTPVAVIHTEASDLPSGAGHRLTHGRLFAHMYHRGDETNAAKDLRAAAAGDPTASSEARALPPRVLDHIRQRCGVRPWQQNTPPVDVPFPDAPTDDETPPAISEQPAPSATPDVRHIMAAASEHAASEGVFPTVADVHNTPWSAPGSDTAPAVLPAFPLHCLPGDTGKFVEAVATYTQTPVEIPAFAAIGALATVVGSHATVTGQWTEETLALFLASIADSGDGKSRAFKEVNRPVYRLETSLRKAWDCQYGELAEQLEIAQHSREKLIKDLASAHGDTRTRLLADLDTLNETIKELTGPPRPQLLAGDILPEALAKLMHKVGGHIGIVSAEGTFMGNICGRYNNGKPNLEFVLQSWDASEPWRPDRISRDSFELERPSLALSLSVQPVVIADAIEAKAVTDKGLLNRFLLTQPTSLAGSRDVRPPHIPAHLVEAWSSCVHRAFYAVRPDGRMFDDDGAPLPPVPMQVGEDAEELMLNWRAQHERRLDPDVGDLVMIKGWMARAAGNAYRMAALLHLAAGHPPKLPVSGNVMADALTVIDYCIPHTIAILVPDEGSRPAAGRPGWVQAACGNVLDWIRKKGMGEFTASHVTQGLKGRGWVKEQGASGVRGVLLALCAEGWLATVARQDAAGRKLSDPLFMSHPDLLGGRR